LRPDSGLGDGAPFDLTTVAPMPLPPAQLTALRALLDRLIPADDCPGALAAGTDDFIVALLAGDCAAEASVLALGLDQLDAEAIARHGHAFAALPSAAQDALLTALEQNCPATAWPASISAVVFFNRMVDLAAEGFYADPANGGNRDAASWRMIGYDPRLPANPTDP
jgi:hypothetical protein